MSNHISIAYTYRNPWPRRLALAAAVLLLLGAAGLSTAHLGTPVRLQGCSSSAAG